MEERGTPAYVAEFIGTFFLVLFICMIVSINSPGGLQFTDFAVIGLVHAFILAMLVYSPRRDVRGALQPRGHGRAGGPAQDRPARRADLLARPVLGRRGGRARDQAPAARRGQGRQLRRRHRVGEVPQGKALSGLLCEIIGTFVLMWAIMGVAVNPRGERAWAGWVIGIALGAGVMVFAPARRRRVQPRPLVRAGDRLG